MIKDVCLKRDLKNLALFMQLQPADNRSIAIDWVTSVQYFVKLGRLREY
jgi:hypothetical protein